MWPRVVRALLLPIKLLFGPDAFVSYSREDGTEYAEALMIALARSISPRADLQETKPGKRIPFSLRLSLVLSKVLVIVNTPMAAKSVNVEEEIRTFVRWSSGPIVAIEVSYLLEKAIWWPHIEGVSQLRKTERTVSTVPVERVTRRVVASVGFWRINRRQSFVATAFSMLLLLLTYFTYWESRAARDATARQIAAGQEVKHQQQLLREAKGETDRQRNQAEAQKALAATFRKEADLQQARGLVALSDNSLGTDPERAILLAMKGVEITLKYQGYAAAEAQLHRAILSSYLRTRLTGHRKPIRALAWSPDGCRLASGSEDGTVRFWETARGRGLSTFSEGKDAVTDLWESESRPSSKVFMSSGYPHHTVLALDWNQSGEFLAIGYAESGVRIVDTVSGKELFVMPPHVHSWPRAVRGVAWSPDSRWLAVSGDYGVILLDWRTKCEKVLYNGQAGNVSWRPDGKHLAFSRGGGASIWDVEERKELFTIPDTGSITWSPSGKLLAAAGVGNTVNIFDSANGKLLYPMTGHREGVDSLAWSPDGRWLASGSQDGTVRVWDVTEGRELRTLAGPTLHVYSVAWSSDGRKLATAGDDKTDAAADVRIWEPLLRTETWAFEGAARNSNFQNNSQLAWDPDGKRLAVIGMKGNAVILDAETVKPVLAFERDPGFSSIAWSSDRKRIATATGGYSSRDHVVAIWDSQTGRKIKEMPVSINVGDLVWSPDGKVLGLGASGSVALLLNPDSGRILQAFRNADSGTQSVAWSPYGNRLAINGAIWSTQTGQKTATLNEFLVTNVAWSPDGKKVATASADDDEDGSANTPHVWDSQSGKLVFRLEGHRGKVRALAWSPDGGRLATADYDTIIIRDGATGKESFRIGGGISEIEGIAWSPDGKRLATVGDDGVVQLYAMDVQTLLELAHKRVTRGFTEAELAGFLHTVQ